MRFGPSTVLAAVVSFSLASPSIHKVRSENVNSANIVLTIDGMSTDAMTPDSIIKCLSDCKTILGDAVCLATAVLPPVSPTAVADVLICVKNDKVGLCHCASCLTDMKALKDFGGLLTKYSICDLLTGTPATTTPISAAATAAP